MRWGQLYFKIKTWLKLNAPPQILVIYLGGNNILMQMRLNQSNCAFVYNKTAKPFQTVANHHFSLVPEFVPGFMEDRDESNRFKKV